MNNKKLIYIDLYFRITFLSDGKNGVSYASVIGTVDGTFSKDSYESYRNEIKEKYEVEGYSGVVVKACSRDEFESREISDETVLGYLRMYLAVVYMEDEKEMTQFAAIDCDFNKFFNESLWDGIAQKIKEHYVNSRKENVKVLSTTEELYAKYTKDSDRESIKFWDDKAE
ncbi:hypothetical protein [Lacrimispora amygdalina]|uniref:hypothetical protein n=1 Tax=Lacrimispora amygdalina TaxID=253257 RepID=UPI000BE30432|nr:hypothetical protein [Lacrimispora amygdalina]